MFDYWDGMVLCPRKGLAHILGDTCLKIYGDECGGCGNKDLTIERNSRVEEEEELRKKERRELVGPKRGPVRKR